MNIAIIGGGGGIGSALAQELLQRTDVKMVFATYHMDRPEWSDSRLAWQQVDITAEQSIQSWTKEIDELDWLINAVGILHTPENGPEKTIRRMDPEYYLQNIRINSLPQLLLAKHVHDKFKHGRPAIFTAISARVGSIEENYLGGWYSYRASKAALNMGIKTLSIEWKRSLPNVIVTALHPGTTDTGLSRPFQRNVPPSQLAQPDTTAARLIGILDNLTTSDSGKFLSFDGTELPW